MGHAGKSVPGVFGTAQSVPGTPSRLVLTPLSLSTYDFRAAADWNHVCRKSGFPLEYNATCREIQTLLLLWDTVWCVELPCGVWETLLNSTGSKTQGYDRYSVSSFLGLCYEHSRGMWGAKVWAFFFLASGTTTFRSSLLR